MLSAFHRSGRPIVSAAGTIGALSTTINANCDALAPLTVRHLEMPATLGRVWAAIRDANR
jgi:aerobic carbon-monoxide dehydrogenase large subunit